MDRLIDDNIPEEDLGPISERMMCLYGVNVNLQRAIPTVSDGLKPIYRRILYAVYERYRWGKFKVASAIGDVMHLNPHGDQGLGDIFARLSQPFTNNIPLLKAHGNGGNVTSGDDAASPRYLSMSISEFAKEVLFDEFDGKVNMMPSYDETMMEPVMLPAKFPIILINGYIGIGYTMSTNIPPFNINEVADATIKLLKNPESKIKLVPDFPTGCDVIVRDDHTFVMQSSFEIDPVNYVITIKNTPYMKYIDDIDDKLRQLQETPNMIKEIVSVSDDSILIDGIFKYTIRCKPCNLYKVIDQLFKKVPGFRVGISTMNMNVVDPSFTTRCYDTRQILLSWIQNRLKEKRAWYLRNLVAKTTKYNVLSGKAFMLSPKNLKTTIKVVSECKTEDAIIPALMETYKPEVSSSQAHAIAELRIGRLNQSEYKKTIEDMKTVKDEIEEIESIVKCPENIVNKIIDDIKEIKSKYGYPRKSKILNNVSDASSVGCVQILTDGSVLFSETESPEHLSSDVTIISDDEVCLIDDMGQFMWVNTNKVPKGKPIMLTAIGKTQMGKCVGVLSSRDNNVLMLTNHGRIKYMPIDKIPSNSSRKPLVPIGGDEQIVSVMEIRDESMDLLVYTSSGIGKRFRTTDLNKVNSPDSVGQFIMEDTNVSGMFTINPNKPYLVYVTKQGKIRVNHLRFLTVGKKFGDPKQIIALSPMDDLVAVFCADKNQSITLNHADSRVTTVNLDSLEPTTMATPPVRPKHVPGVKVVRATLQ